MQNNVLQYVILNNIVNEVRERNRDLFTFVVLPVKTIVAHTVAETLLKIATKSVTNKLEGKAEPSITNIPLLDGSVGSHTLEVSESPGC